MQGRKLRVDTLAELNHLKEQLEKYREAQKATGCIASMHDFSRAVGLKRIDVRRVVERHFPDLTFTLNKTTYDLKGIVPISKLYESSNSVKGQQGNTAVKRTYTKRTADSKPKTVGEGKSVSKQSPVSVTQAVGVTKGSPAVEKESSKLEEDKGIVFPEIMFVDRPYFPISREELDKVRRRDFLKGIPADKIISLEESYGLRWSFLAKREKVSLFIVSSFFARRGIPKQADGVLPEFLAEKLKDFMLNNKVTVLYAVKHLNIIPQLVEKSEYVHLERKQEGIAEKVARGRKKKLQTVTPVTEVEKPELPAPVSPQIVAKEKPKTELTTSLSDKLSAIKPETLKYVTTSMEHDLDYKLRNLLSLSDSEIVELKLYLGFNRFNSALVSLCENR